MLPTFRPLNLRDSVQNYPRTIIITLDIAGGDIFIEWICRGTLHAHNFCLLNNSLIQQG